MEELAQLDCLQTWFLLSRGLIELTPACRCAGRLEGSVHSSSDFKPSKHGHAYNVV